jgi:hypothetical protein
LGIHLGDVVEERDGDLMGECVSGRSLVFVNYLSAIMLSRLCEKAVLSSNTS